jgi:hypothetical protein
LYLYGSRKTEKAVPFANETAFFVKKHVYTEGS